MVQSESSANRGRGGVAHCGIGGSLIATAYLVSARDTVTRRGSCRKSTGALGASQIHPILAKALFYLLSPKVSSSSFPLALESIDSRASLSEQSPRTERCRWWNCNRRRLPLHCHGLDGFYDSASCLSLGLGFCLRNGFWFCQFNWLWLCWWRNRLFSDYGPFSRCFVQRSFGSATALFFDLTV